MNRIKNAKKHTIEGVLFLQGVFKKDCKKIEDFFTDRLLGDGRVDVKQYDKIPTTFVSLETHPKNTNLLCWNCCRSFKGRPWFEPQSIDVVNKGAIGAVIPYEQLNKSAIHKCYSISIKGNFCNPCCVRRYINTNTKDLSERLNKIAMLKFVYEIFLGRCIKDITPAPPHTEMIQYGGNRTTADYQKKLEDLDTLQTSDDNNFAGACREYANKLFNY
jgi:hypothetical protein